MACKRRGQRLQKATGLDVPPGRAVGTPAGRRRPRLSCPSQAHFPRSHFPGDCPAAGSSRRLVTWPGRTGRPLAAGIGAGSMTGIVALPGGRTASYEIIGSGRPALMFAGGPGFPGCLHERRRGLLSDVLCSYLIDPHGSGSSTPPASPADYSPEGHARFYEEVRRALALPEVVVLGHSFGATTALTYAALYPQSTAMCVAVAAFGIGPDADARREVRPRPRPRPCWPGTPARRGMRRRGRSWTPGPSACWPQPMPPRWNR